MLGNVRRTSGHLDAVARVESWVRSRFSLSDAAVVMVAEVECQMPGCPPIETIAAFWGEDGTRYRFKIFKPVAKVVEDDLPISWLLPSLVDYGELGCDCC
jgi:nitrate reductase delta subunit